MRGWYPSSSRWRVIPRSAQVAAAAEASNLTGRLVAQSRSRSRQPESESGITREVINGLLSTQQFLDHALGYCNGTTVLHLGSRALPEFRFASPGQESVQILTLTMRPLLLRSDSARAERRVLANLLDTLLPKLMSVSCG